MAEPPPKSIIGIIIEKGWKLTSSGMEKQRQTHNTLLSLHCWRCVTATSAAASAMLSYRLICRVKSAIQIRQNPLIKGEHAEKNLTSLHVARKPRAKEAD